MKVAVVVFPGSNCDYDVYYAIKAVMKGDAELVWHKAGSLQGFDAVVLPGGFSYGDYLRAGAIARFSPVVSEVVSFAKKGRPVLGICNGFQTLTESGLLPGALRKNQHLRFVCRHIHIRTENNRTIFTKALKRGQVLKVPVAHGEGNFYIDDDGLKRLQENDQVVFRYGSKDGRLGDEFNPNGSIDNIAGIINKAGNVLGMMPHPERAMEHILASADGKSFFESMYA
jgi:phosphoribosylformylglycinamidine synthase I